MPFLKAMCPTPNTSARNYSQAKEKASNRRPSCRNRDLALQKRATVGGEDFEEENANLVLNKVVKVVVKLDAGLDHTSSTLMKLLQDFQENIKSQDLTATILSEQNNATSELIGGRPNTLKLEYDSPSLSGAVAAIAAKFNEIETRPGASFDAFQAEPIKARGDIQNELASKTSIMDMKLNQSKTTLVKAFSLLSYKIGTNTARVADLEQALSPGVSVAAGTGILHSTTPAPNTAAETKATSTATRLLEECIKKLAFTVGKLSAKSNTLAVKFGRLGFESINKSTAWLTEHVVNGGFELIVDPVVVMEHVWARISGECNIPSWKRCTN